MREINLVVSHTIEFKRETSFELPGSEHLIRIFYITTVELEMFFNRFFADAIELGDVKLPLFKLFSHSGIIL